MPIDSAGQGFPTVAKPEETPVTTPPLRRAGHPKLRTPVPGQGKLEFLPAAPRGPKVLKISGVEAAIYCDAKAASWQSRITAAMLDVGMIAGALAIFAGILRYRCGATVLDRHQAPYYILLAALIALFYEGLWAIAGRPTAGMSWVNLRLLNFDGHHPESGQRFLWFAGSYLSLLAAGAGLLWSLVDEEHLTWHDHIAKTFPTANRVRNTPFHRG